MFHNVHVRSGFKIYALMPKERKVYFRMCDLNFKSHELSYQKDMKKIKICVYFIFGLFVSVISGNCTVTFIAIIVKISRDLELF